MEIHGNTTTLAPPAAGPRDVKGSGAKGEAEGAGSGQAAGTRADASGGSRVAVSDRARGMLAIRRAVDEAPDVRVDKVDDLKAEVSAGTYDVRGRLVAEAMVHEALVEAVA
jgi:negative regulator of flagellin synthesis FlgM